MNGKPIKSANVLKIYDRLRQSPVTLDVLFDWVKRNGIDVSRRTLYRYLNTLAGNISFQGEKLLVYENEFNKKVWKIEYDKSAATLNQFDINSYYILRNFIPQSLSTPREASLKKLDTLMYELASKSRFQLNVDVNNLSFVRSNYSNAQYTSEQHTLLEDLIWAIQHHRKIKVEKFDWDRALLPEGFANGMMVLPLRILFHNGLIQICGYSEDTHKVIVLPFHEIMELSVTNISFAPAPYYPYLEKYFEITFGVLHNVDEYVYEIEIEFAGHAGTFVKSMQWHSSQSFEELDNGNILMRLRCGINRELIAFVLYFFNNAKVLKPMKLRNMLLLRLREIMEVYENNSDEFVYKTTLVQSEAELITKYA